MNVNSISLFSLLLKQRFISNLPLSCLLNTLSLSGVNISLNWYLVLRWLYSAVFLHFFFLFLVTCLLLFAIFFIYNLLLVVIDYLMGFLNLKWLTTFFFFWFADYSVFIASFLIFFCNVSLLSPLYLELFFTTFVTNFITHNYLYLHCFLICKLFCHKCYL